MTGGQLLRRLAGRAGEPLPAGAEADDAAPPTSRHERPGVASAARAGFESAGPRAAPAPALPLGHGGRQAVTQQHLSDELDQALLRGGPSSFRGVLAVVGVVDPDRLGTPFDAATREVVAAAFDELVAADAEPREEHAPRTAGGFWVLMPDSDAAAAFARLRRLTHRIVSSVVAVDGRELRLRPVVGYATLGQASSVDELLSHAGLALAAAEPPWDVVPVAYSPGLQRPGGRVAGPSSAVLELLPSRADRLRLGLQVAFTSAVLLVLPFIVYVLAWKAGADLSTVAYPLLVAGLAVAAIVVWAEACSALKGTEPPPVPGGAPPFATAIVVAAAVGDAPRAAESVRALIADDADGPLQIVVAYLAEERPAIERELAQLAREDPRLLLLPVTATSRAPVVARALEHARGEVVGIFDADQHPLPGSFPRAWRWLARGHDVVQARAVVRNGEDSWVARLAAVEAESAYGVVHPGRAHLHGFDAFGGANRYWRRRALQRTGVDRPMPTGDSDPGMAGRQYGLSIVADPGLVSTALAPTTPAALWRERLALAEDGARASRTDLWPALRSPRLNLRQKLGAGLVLGWAQVVPWLTLQAVPLLAFVVWRDRGLDSTGWLLAVGALLVLSTVVVAVVQASFAAVQAHADLRRHRGWFALHALHSTLWFGELKHLATRVAQVRELTAERRAAVPPPTPARRGSRVMVQDEAPREHRPGPAARAGSRRAD